MQPPFEKIASFQNPKIKQIKNLRDRRARDRESLFVIDDGRDLSRALDCGYSIAYALFCPELPQGDDELLARIPGDIVYEVSPAIMEKTSYRQNPSSLVAVMRQKAILGLDDLHDRGNTVDSHILALVNLQKPGNIGALLRTADATGFKAITLVDSELDIYNPNIIRSSTGACFLDNIYVMTSEEALSYFRENGFTIIAADVNGDVDLFDAGFGQRAAITLGTEDRGLDALWLHNANQRVRIPMVGKLSDSLNVSVSGAIFMVEALRQRR